MNTTVDKMVAALRGFLATKHTLFGAYAANDASEGAPDVLRALALAFGLHPTDPESAVEAHGIIHRQIRKELASGALDTDLPAILTLLYNVLDFSGYEWNEDATAWERREPVEASDG